MHGSAVERRPRVGLSAGILCLVLDETAFAPTLFEGDRLARLSGRQLLLVSTCWPMIWADHSLAISLPRDDDAAPREAIEGLMGRRARQVRGFLRAGSLEAEALALRIVTGGGIAALLIGTREGPAVRPELFDRLDELAPGLPLRLV